MKVMSGEGVKAHSRTEEGEPGGGKNSGGIGPGAAAKPRRIEQRTRARNKALRARSRVLALVGNRQQESPVNDERARDADEADRLCLGDCLFRANPGRGCGVK
jgi:hypothetical protein